MCTLKQMIGGGVLVASVALMFGCKGPAAPSNDDIAICKQFVNEAIMRMQELKQDAFKPDDLTLSQLAVLTPREPRFLHSGFLVLKNEWIYKGSNKCVVIVCAQSRAETNGRLVHAVAFNNGETAWIPESELSVLKLADYVVLPQLR